MRRVLGLSALLLLLAITAATAQAASTRTEYVAQVDPTCQSAQAQEAVEAQPLRRLTRQVKKHPNRKTGKRLARELSIYSQQIAAIEHAANNQIATIPPAPDDVSLVQVWLRSRNELADLEAQAFGNSKVPKNLKGLGQLFANIFELSARELEVQDLVRDFGFQYCNQPSLAEVQIIG